MAIILGPYMSKGAFKYHPLAHFFLKIISPNLMNKRWNEVCVCTFMFVSRPTYPSAFSDEPQAA